MKHKKSLWRHLVWSFLIPLVVGQIPAAGVLAWELQLWSVGSQVQRGGITFSGSSVQ